MHRPFVVIAVMLVGAVLAGTIADQLHITARGPADTAYAVSCFFWGVALYMLLAQDTACLLYLMAAFGLGAGITSVIAWFGHVRSTYAGGMLGFTFLCLGWGMAFYGAATRPPGRGLR